MQPLPSSATWTPKRLPIWPIINDFDDINTVAVDPFVRVRANLDRLAGSSPALGVAVSGGGDSVALMHMIARWRINRRVQVATVDHGLRPESRAEADTVARQAADLGLRHDILTWQRPVTGSGNLMAEARKARLHLLSHWAKANDLAMIALGHTADDQAETLVMRLDRGAGVDGLAAMAPARQAHGTIWLRPMLDVTRDDLRDWLQAEHLDWIDDPSNENDDYERVRVRKVLRSSGWQIARIAESAANLREVRSALSYYALQTCADANFANAAVDLDVVAFHDAPAEIRRRILIAATRWVTGAPYPARRATVSHAMDAVNAGKRVTLDGVLIHPRGDRLHIIREPAAALRAAAGRTTWDGRWRITDLPAHLRISALGLRNLSGLNWRDHGLSHDEAIASPAIYDRNQLIEAPLLQPQGAFRVTPLRSATDFRSLVMAH
ncbi:tRNA lysidine(34) synthetase TilS [Paracoccus sp. Z330]|uniref:tRNA(Ile)-lysidine synthase n=1 Tax=Paracoccus onchidii TaxID=3017813 RepID=A0ABT4ZAP4_9RHOB|nr:tRNA lysidine(34) synthetase TilS [Paracoccus onchidii]MDB6176426.1 tRNA lysidine(34) synthetase TilS [Paracoccus onchidii]